MKKITIPTVVTLVRIALVVPFVICLSQITVGGVLAAMVIFMVASLSDALDGVLARGMGQISDLGAFLDPLADKMLINSAFVCLSTLWIVPYWVPIIFICRDCAVDGMRMMAAKNGKTIAASMLGKMKTMAQMIALPVLMISTLGLCDPTMRWLNGPYMDGICIVLSLIAVVLSVVSGVEYLVRGIKEFS